MSAETKKKGNIGYTPNEPPPTSEPLMTAAQFQSQQQFFLEQVKALKKMFEESNLAVWIKLAGLGAVAELLHVAWLAYRYWTKQ